MDTSDRSESRAIEAAAATWHTELDCGTADVAAFEAWRDADPRHAVAFARVNAAGDLLDTLGGLSVPGDPDLAPSAKRKRRGFLKWGTAGLAAAGAAILPVGVVLINGRAHASTPVGGRQTVQLPDGGTIDINTDTRVSWKYTPKSRHIWLEKGEVAITIPAGAADCIVAGGVSRVSVAAGKINMRQRQGALDVTVQQGQCLVSVADVKKAASPVLVTAGEGALAGGGEVRVRKVGDDSLAAASSWQSDELIFNGDPLSVAVDEYNRYLTDKIVINDTSLSGLRLGGRFSTRDPAGFLSALETTFQVHVSRDGSGTILLSR